MKPLKDPLSGFSAKMKIAPSENIGNSDTGTGTIEKTRNKEDEPWRDALLCRQCMSFITRESSRTTVNGAHVHMFANPHGIVFEIGCFQNAAGCANSGPPSGEFSWFPPNSWQAVICASCLAHMGWRFLSPRQTVFFGLILDRLVSPGP